MDEMRLKTFRPDYVVILPWNLLDEVIAQLAYIREWGGQFVTSIPGLNVHKEQSCDLPIYRQP